MSDFEVAHYQGLLSGGMIWAVFLIAVAIAFAMRHRVEAPAAASEGYARRPWVAPACISAAVITFFCAVPFLVYGPGPDTSARGLSMVIANQAGYATSFLLVGLLAAGFVRLLGFKGRGAISFAVGTCIGIGLSAFAATMNNHSWLLAPT